MKIMLLSFLKIKLIIGIVANTINTDKISCYAGLPYLQKRTEKEYGTISNKNKLPAQLRIFCSLFYQSQAVQ